MAEAVAGAPSLPRLLEDALVFAHRAVEEHEVLQKMLQTEPELLTAQLTFEDAAALEAAEGDWVRVTSRRGSIEVPVRVGGIERGRVFVPFHYGYWDDPEAGAALGKLIARDPSDPFMLAAVLSSATKTNIQALAKAAIGAASGTASPPASRVSPRTCPARSGPMCSTSCRPSSVRSSAA